MSRAHRFQAFSRSIDFLNLMDAFMRDTMTTTPEKQQRKHAELIHAWADGATIEFKVREGVWAIIRTPLWEDDVEYRIQPAPPAKVYPTTLMTDHDLNDAVNVDAQSVLGRAKSVANAAIKHAVDNDQVVPMAECVELGRELSKRYHAKRELAIVEAAVNAAWVARPAWDAHKDILWFQTAWMYRLNEIDRAAVIAGVDAARKIAVADDRAVLIKADLSNLDVKVQS